MSLKSLVPIVIVYAASVFVATSAFRHAFSPQQFIRHGLRLTNHQRFMSTKNDLPTDDNGWRTILSPDQFAVLRKQSTEPPGYSENTPGELEYELKKSVGTKYPKTGVYTCVACNAPLYTAQSKFDSGCGWPAFYEGVKGAIKEVPDADGRRVEIVCSNCNSHLGHVFKNEGEINITVIYSILLYYYFQ